MNKNEATTLKLVRETIDLEAEIASLKSENANHQVTIRQLREEVERMKGIVDKLPKTADGVVVIPWVDEEIYHNGDRAAWYTKKLTNTMTGQIVTVAECYSTRKAAAAAMNKG